MRKMFSKKQIEELIVNEVNQAIKSSKIKSKSYIIQGVFTTSDETLYNVIPQLVDYHNDKVYVVPVANASPNFYPEFTINFKTHAIENNDGETLSLDSAYVELIDVISFETIELLEI